MSELINNSERRHPSGRSRTRSSGEPWQSSPRFVTSSITYRHSVVAADGQSVGRLWIA